ncbi:type II toxin-antitoxin system RelE/ParE family toxin [Leeuwenhoekiella marinoflava]|uniref:Plasmid stabilization system protein ParE n=2 Tax=Leeuwenhoekiella marinoflava TaxID=988 RepID=A0A4Q0PMQ3_9FLAO|nr:type II toxin-antitoxin system RelE/ParE family toxin [Leeuwenhoekiella marinoflava]RXG31703.1 plasmid stabilization system protein ParE [Leeuwenhoekiella marinoflava]SHF08072.1 Plasmid stabilization system protein ParE [Leeuwenhoekiella marinoflava DSM 3653]
MAKRNVIWTRTADIQFVGILEYWVKRNKSNTYSKKLVKLVSERTKQIADEPLIYKATDFKDVRLASMGNFSIYYKVADNEITITAFWDNRQNPKKLLEILENKK